MKFTSGLILALVLAGCCGCFSQPKKEVVVVSPSPRVEFVAVQPRPVVVETVTVRKTKSRSLLGDVLVGATLICADVVGIVFPIDERTEVLRERFYSNDF